RNATRPLKGAKDLTMGKYVRLTVAVANVIDLACVLSFAIAFADEAPARRLPVYAWVAVGAVAVLAWLSRPCRPLALPMIGAVLFVSLWADGRDPNRRATALLAL